MDGYIITLTELIWHFRYIIILCSEVLSTIMPKFGLQGNVFRALWETLKLALFYFFPHWDLTSPAVTYFFSHWDLFSLCLIWGELGSICENHRKEDEVHIKVGLLETSLVTKTHWLLMWNFKYTRVGFRKLHSRRGLEMKTWVVAYIPT